MDLGSLYVPCSCTDTQKRIAVILLIFTTILVFLSFGGYISGVNNTRDWADEKKSIRATARHLAKETGKVERQVLEKLYGTDRPGGTNIDHIAVANDPAMLQWLDAMENLQLGSEGNGFAFVMDASTRIWAHGKSRHLAWNGGYRASDNVSMKDTDNLFQYSTPAANMRRATDRGGGFVYSRWKDGVLLLTYICPVKGSDLSVGVSVPIPNSIRVWDEAIIRNADIEAFTDRKDSQK